MLMSGVASEIGGNMSATSKRNTIMERRLVMTKVILSPESGGTLKAKMLRAKRKRIIILFNTSLYQHPGI